MVFYITNLCRQLQTRGNSGPVANWRRYGILYRESMPPVANWREQWSSCKLAGTVVQLQTGRNTVRKLLKHFAELFGAQIVKEKTRA
jgi:hypothetical protein